MSDYIPQFNTGLNFPMVEANTGSLSSALASLFTPSGLVATGTDIAATVWNSLPGTEEVDTEDWLARINNDALNVYKEHPDAVSVASLIGGSFAAGGPVLKVLSGARNGLKSANWFTTAGKQRDIARAAEMVANGAKGTSDYKKLIWATRGRTAANNILDAGVAELAMLGTMSAHPLLEDYNKDFMQNFGLSLAVGGGLGTGIGLITDGFARRSATSAIESGALARVLGAITPTQPSMPEAAKVQALQRTITSLDEIIEGRVAAGKVEVDDLLYGQAALFQRQFKKEQLETFDAMLGGEISKWAPAEQQKLLDNVLNNEGFIGVEKIGELKVKETLGSKLKTIAADAFDQLPTLTKTDAQGAIKSQKAVYYPSSGKFGSVDDLDHHAGLAALKLTDEGLAARVPDKMSRLPNHDAAFDMVGKSTPHIDADYGAWTAKFHKMDDDAFSSYMSKAKLSPADLPQLQAVFTRMSASNKLRNTLKVNVADEAAYTLGKANAILGEVDVKRAMGGAPLKYQEAAERLLNNKSVGAKYDLQSVNPMVRKWISGSGVRDMHNAARAYFAKGFAKSGATIADMDAAAEFAKIYESAESVALRADLLSKLADVDGKIYLYRGVNAPKIFGQAPLESMAVTPGKAGQFATGAHGNTHLYKIDVDDVVASVVDIGPNGVDNVELIVRASAREAEATLSKSGQLVFRKSGVAQAAKETPPAPKMYGDLADMLKEGKHKLYTSLLAQGYPIESIAKRLNLSDADVQRLMAGTGALDDFDNITPYLYKNAEDVLAANAPTMRPLEVSGNLRKADYTAARANLNARTLNSINELFMGNIIQNSESSIVREVGKALMEEYKPMLDIARGQLSRIVNEAAGNRFISDAGHFSRMMGELGPLFSVVGNRMTHIANKASAAVVKPIGELMGPISKDVAALTEFSIGNNLNRSLSGWRTYQDRQFWQKVKSKDASGKTIETLEAVMIDGREFKVATDSVDDLFKHMQAQSGDLYHLASAQSKITGSHAVNDIGFWSPSWNPIDKHVAYVHDAASDTTRVIYGKSANELEDAIRSFAPEMLANKTLKIVRKGDDQALWSKLNGRVDPIQMGVANTSMKRSGAGASAIPRISTDVLAEVAGGYEHYINAHIRNLNGVILDDIVDALDKMSAAAQNGFKGQALSAVKQVTQAPKDAAKSMKNLLMGNPSLGEFEGWKNLNRGFESVLSYGSNAMGSAYNSVVAPIVKNPLKRGAPGPEDFKRINYDEYERQLNAAGVFNMFEGPDRALAAQRLHVATQVDSPEVSKRLVTATNALAATVVLRFGEVAHGLVNLVSMPILMTLANSQKAMPASFMGIQKGTAQVSTARVMMDGARAMNSDKFKHLRSMWEERGYFTPLVSEASDVLRASKSFEGGPVAAIENAVNSNFVKWGSTLSDKSEELSRRYTMHTGYLLGKRMYPELGDEALTVFARDFMDKSLGNYSASQRPVFFQGTMGMAMGLFQTYMLTFAQSMYRNVEVGDWKNIGKAMLAQQGIFGFSSMPGFDPISKMIGEHFSDDNVDLTTGTYRALEGPEAEWFLYGAPSNLLGSSMYSRGDIAPRLPNLAAGMDKLPGANFAMQSFELVGNMASAVSRMDATAGQAMLEALSLQSMSRPLARAAEIGSAALYEGGSVTRGGMTVQTAEEVLTLNGIAARILSTRPLEEGKLRHAEHLRTYYGAADRENRTEAVKAIRTAIRAGKLDQDKVEKAMEKYFRNNGTPTGWNAAYQEALVRTPMNGTEQILDKLQEDDPLTFMVNSF